MLWPILNLPGVLWKKLDRVKDCAIVWIVKFLRATQGKEGGMGRRMRIYFIDLNPTYVVANFELAMCLVEKVEEGQRLWNCLNSQIF